MEMQNERSWTEQQLRDAVAAATSLRAVLRALGLKYGSGGYVARRIAELGIDTSHFKSNASPSLRISDERLRELVPKCVSASEVLQLGGLTLHGRTFTVFTNASVGSESTQVISNEGDRATVQ